MKKFWLLILFLSILFSCSENSKSNNNPYIPNYTINERLDTNLPLYNNLKYASNPVMITTAGAKGLIVMKVGEGSYTAFDAACPNQALNSCVAMTIDGINAVCSCDKSTYSLYTGLGDKEYPMKQYKTEISGSVVRVYN